MRPNLAVDNQVIAKEAGAIEITVRAMNKHIKNPTICEKGCLVIRNVATNGKQKKNCVLFFLFNWPLVCLLPEAHNKEIAGKAGAIEIIVKILRQHLNNVDMCENGLAALWSVSFGDCSSTFIKLFVSAYVFFHCESL